LAKPYDKKQDKKSQIRAMFNSIARRYDFLNHFLSFGIDILWRKKLIRQLKAYKPTHILDVATGTADLALMAVQKIPHIRVTGIDLSEGMIDVGNQKLNDRSLNDQIKLQVADSEALPFSDQSFDAAMVAFGVRNFENLEKGLSEILRVLQSERPLFILEFSSPKRFPMKQLYRFYSNTFLPFVGRIVSKDPKAYSYLPESITEFPHGSEFLRIMNRVGYRDCNFKELSFGIATIYWGVK
jgi:demethylmenaquinone methyltransferase / 2-methoxy-6-polyprenyl-1,4-benzoquinol methylase